MAEKIQLEITLENGQFKTKVKESTASVQGIGVATDKAGTVGKRGFGKMAQGAKLLSTAMKALVALQIIKVFYDIGKASLGSAMAMEQHQVAFSTMLGSAAKAKKLLNEIKAFAASTPFQLPGLIETSKRLVAFGVAETEVISTMRMLGDASMGNVQALETLSDVYGKVKVSGRASMEDINRIADRGVGIYSALADSMGVSEEQVRTLVSKGKVGFKELNKAFRLMTSEGGRYAGMMEQSSRTLGGLVSTLKDKVFDLLLTFGQNILPAFKNLVKAFSFGTESGGVFTKALSLMSKGVSFTVNAIATLVNGIVLLSSTIREYYNKALKRYHEYSMTNLRERMSAMSGEALTERNLTRTKLEQLATRSGAMQRLAAEYLQHQLSAEEADGAAETAATAKAAALDRAANSLRAMVGITAETTQLTNDATDAEERLNDELRRRRQPGGAGDAEAEARIKKFEERRDLVAAYYDWEHTLAEDRLMAEMERNQKARASHEQMIRAKMLMNTQEYEGMKMISSMGYALMASKNKKIFAIGKALAISNTIMNASEAIIKGFSYGPWIGIPYAALVTTATAIQMKKIKEQKPPEMATGTMNVPADMPAIVHQGEIVVPRPMAESIRSGEASLGGEEEPKTTIVQIDGETIFEIMDGKRGEQADSMGVENYHRGSVYA